MLGFLVVAFSLVITIGLKGWTTLVIPNIGRVSQFSLPLLLGFSFLAGAVSFFAPCAFALFPGYAAFYLGSEGERIEHPAVLGVTAALGAASFFVLLSGVLIFLGKGVMKYLRYVSPAVGFILVVLGAVLLAGYSFKMDLIQRTLDRLRSKEKRSKRNIFLFGFGYGAVSIGCTLPLLFALIIVPITAGKLFTVLLSLLSLSLAMSVLMVSVTILVAWSEVKLIKKMVESTGTIKKLAGLTLILVGAYLIYYNIFYGMMLP